MREHYGLTEDQYSSLKKKGITDLDFVKFVPLFDPNGAGCELGDSVVPLMYFMDRKGGIDTKPMFPSKRIAQCMFENLTRIKDKIAVAEYGELADNNFEEDEDE